MSAVGGSQFRKANGSEHLSSENTKDSKSAGVKFLPDSITAQSSECMNSESAAVESLPLSGGKQSAKASECGDSSSESMSCSDSANVKSLLPSVQSAKVEVLSSKGITVSTSAKGLSKSIYKQSAESISDSDSTRLHLSDSKQSSEGEELSSEGMKNNYSSSVISMPSKKSAKASECEDLSTEDSSSSEATGMKLLTESKLPKAKESSSESLISDSTSKYSIVRGKNNQLHLKATIISG